MRFILSLLFLSAAFVHAQQFDTLTALSKNEQALNLLDAGKFRQALPVAKEAYRLICKAEGEKSPNSLTIMGNLLLIHERLGQFKKLELLYQRCLRLKTQVNGPENYDTLITMKNFGSFLRKIGKLKKSGQILQKTLNLQIKTLGRENDYTLITMQSLATTYTQLGKFPQAEKLYKSCIKTLEKQRKSSAAIINNDFAELYKKMGRYSAAAKLLRNCIAARQKLLGISHPETLISLHNLGALYIETGEYDKAENLYTSLKKHLTESLEKHHPLVLNVSSNLALLYRENLELTRSLKINREVLDIRSKTLGPTHPDTIDSMNNLAANLSLLGQYNKAELLYRDALRATEKIFGKNHLEYLTTQVNLASNYIVQSRYRTAYVIMSTALKKARDLLGKDHPFVTRVLANMLVIDIRARSVNWNPEKINRLIIRLRQQFGANSDLTMITHINLSSWLLSRNKTTQAYELLEYLYQNLFKRVQQAHRLSIVLIANFGFVCFQLKKYDQAQSDFELLRGVIEKKYGKDHYLTIRIKFLLARVYAKKKDPRALKTYESATTQLYVFMKNLLLTTNKKTRLNLFSTYKDLQENALQFYVDTSASKKLFDHSLRFKSLLFEISSRQQISRNEENLQNINKLRKKRRQLTTMYFQKNADKNQELTDIYREIEKLESLIASKNTIKSTITREQIQNQIRDTEAVIDFLVVKNNLIATVVTKKKLHMIKIRNWNTILQSITQLRGQITKKAKVTSEISRLLYSPLQAYLKNIKRIYIIPDRDLFLLPFSCLNINGEYLAQKYQVVTLNSAADLWADKSDISKEQNITIFANPDFDAQISEKNAVAEDLFFRALSGTKNEAEYLQTTFKRNGYKTYIYVEKKATKQQFSSMNGQILHIATHGFSLFGKNTEQEDTRGISQKKTIELPIIQKIAASPDSYVQASIKNLGKFDPFLLCGLAFAGANHNTQQIATAYEIQQLDLHNTRLVVLSACETDVGEIRKGSGVIGIRRAFRDAGAKTVVSTLWQIDDKATALFIKTFYDYLLDGVSVRNALHLTQKKFIQHTKYNHPFYWGAFIVDGVDTRIAKPRPKSSLLTIIIVVTLLVVILIVVIIGMTRKRAAQRQRLQERTQRRQLRSR
ncbi:CHAT domain-containing tetratricopeptide repeat protein [Candidatus Uabimicrobium amorphum]|uniref:CHAT domain-containing protein n=1 Tax=Uabimicrobium amorphum TaxID=2596890 RepID=A0A5S9IR29_UABAM|nr:CHAT domain-containing tetratricopeptide repeat protein [Candidatus Uabimicrobium amorphum]BBM86519.1 hypothetical protein UABAM_04905 [Candidatus Uabimicrobium amorphum]